MPRLVLVLVPPLQRRQRLQRLPRRLLLPPTGPVALSSPAPVERLAVALRTAQRGLMRSRPPSSYLWRAQLVWALLPAQQSQLAVAALAQTHVALRAQNGGGKDRGNNDGRKACAAHPQARPLLLSLPHLLLSLELERVQRLVLSMPQHQTLPQELAMQRSVQRRRPPLVLQPAELLRVRTVPLSRRPFLSSPPAPSLRPWQQLPAPLPWPL